MQTTSESESSESFLKTYPVFLPPLFFWRRPLGAALASMRTTCSAIELQARDKKKETTQSSEIFPRICFPWGNTYCSRGREGCAFFYFIFCVWQMCLLLWNAARCSGASRPVLALLALLALLVASLNYIYMQYICTYTYVCQWGVAAGTRFSWFTCFTSCFTIYYIYAVYMYLYPFISVRVAPDTRRRWIYCICNTIWA